MNRYFVYSCGDFYVAFVKINRQANIYGKLPRNARQLPDKEISVLPIKPLWW